MQNNVKLFPVVLKLLSQCKFWCFLSKFVPLVKKRQVKTTMYVFHCEWIRVCCPRSTLTLCCVPELLPHWPQKNAAYCIALNIWTCFIIDWCKLMNSASAQQTDQLIAISMSWIITYFLPVPVTSQTICTYVYFDDLDAVTVGQQRKIFGVENLNFLKN